jgi:DNA polymerase III subunit delta'
VSFDKIQFQPAAVRMLRAAVAGDRVAHAYLFAGPRGVGKGLAARELAKLLMCRSPRGKTADTIDPCDRCEHCRKIDRDVHPDLAWFRKEEDRNDFRTALVRPDPKDPADVVVTVTEAAALTPMEAGRKVIVLDDAELMNRHAANALLKTLEEPAERTVLILLCADVSQLPGTILSRCQWVRFGPLPEEFVAQKVGEVLAAQAAKDAGRGSRKPARSVSAEEIAYAARFAGGSIEQAARLAATGLWNLKRQLLQQLPTMNAATALDMAEAIQAWGREVMKESHVKDGTPEGNAVRRWAARLGLAAAASALGDAAIVAAGGAEAGRLINGDQRQVIDALAGWSVEACGRAVAILADAQSHISRYVHTELATENALIQVSRVRG